MICRFVHGTYLFVPFPSHSNLCLSHLIPWDSHRNDIPVDKPDNLQILSSVFLIEIFDLLGKELKSPKNCFSIITENPYKILRLQDMCG